MRKMKVNVKSVEISKNEGRKDVLIVNEGLYLVIKIHSFWWFFFPFLSKWKWVLALKKVTTVHTPFETIIDC